MIPGNGTVPVLDSCGSEVFRGVVLTPYVVIFSSAVIFMALGTVWKVIRIRYGEWWCALRCCAATRNCFYRALSWCCRLPSTINGGGGGAFSELDGGRGDFAVEAAALAADPDTDSNAGWVAFILRVDLLFVFFQMGVHIVHFVYIASTIPRELSAFHAYSMIYARFLNSGVVTIWGVILSIVTLPRSDVDLVLSRPDHTYERTLNYVFLLLVGLLIPPVLTHIIPMSFGPYIWLLAVPLCAVLVISYLQWRAGGGGGGGSSHFGPRTLSPFQLVIRLGLILFTVVWVQTPFNYGVLWLSGGSECSYTQIMRTEYDMRSTNAYFDSLTSTAHQLFSFVSFF